MSEVIALPTAMDSERLLLGALMVDFEAYRAALDMASKEWFSTDTHRRIFAALERLDKQAVAVDRVSLAGNLQDAKHLESVGGVSYLIDLDTNFVPGMDLSGHVRILGEKAALRAIISEARRIEFACILGEASAEVIATAEAQLSRITASTANRGDSRRMLSPSEVIEASGGLESFLCPKQQAGSETPWLALTQKTGGYRPGELIVIAANTGMGKSAMAVQVGVKVAQGGHGVLFVSLEMSRESLLRRAVCAIGRVDGEKLRGGFTNSDERMRLRLAAQQVHDLPLWIAEHGISTVSAIRNAVRQKKQQEPVLLVIVDYLQIMKSLSRSQNRHMELSEITRTLKLLAMEEKVCIILLSQLSRDNFKDKRPPMLSDLRESGSIEETADCVQFIWRPEMLFRDKEELRGLAEILIAKQRSGPTGKVRMVWLAGYTKFEQDADERRASTEPAEKC